MRCKMAASYKKLFKLLIDREMKSKDLAAKAGVSTVTLAKMKKDGATVSSDVLVKICTALNCTMDDIVDIIHSDKGIPLGSIACYCTCRTHSFRHHPRTRKSRSILIRV